VRRPRALPQGCGAWNDRRRRRAPAHPRTRAQQRSGTRGSHRGQCECAVTAPTPRPDPFVVDRYLAAAASAGLAAWIVVNKSDLEDHGALQRVASGWQRAGYELMDCSARSGTGIDRLVRLLRPHTSVIVGQSGVGKSSLLTRLVPSAAVAIGELTSKLQEGRHTTTYSRMYDLPGGGAVIDSPGVRDFAPAIASLEPRSLGFVEIERLSADCRFADCRHVDEPGCAVRAAADCGALDERRYESYRRLRRLAARLTDATSPR
jgi:ribosome biogenesis GTPase